jgi:hypothetical protein
VCLDSNSCSFTVSDCSFLWSKASSIYFAATPQSTLFGSNCFLGAGRHIESSLERTIHVNGLLCFSNSQADAIQLILFSVESGGEGASFHCSSCGSPGPDSPHLPMPMEMTGRPSPKVLTSTSLPGLAPPSTCLRRARPLP